MNLARAGLVLATFCSVAGLQSCSRATDKLANNQAPAANQSADNTNSTKTNPEELGMLVGLPYVAEDIVWKEDASRKKVIAVLRFSHDDSSRLVSEAEKIRPPESVKLSAETWFPEELIAQSEMGGGDDELAGSSYAANQFYQDQYESGRIVRVENTDFFVLELTAK